MNSINNIELVRKYLKERLQRDYTTLRKHEEEWKNIHDLLERTADNGESNSVLLIGPRGCGKTTLISSALCSLLNQKSFIKNTIIVSLNGLIHTDDRIALKGITLQLNLDNAVDGKVFGSFAENLAFLLACLKSGDKESKSIIFILDEFDLFCGHHNQTLLYNLFDVAQSAQAPICVVGVTCRLDVIELLEKRVKSRFSHRQIFMFPEDVTIEERMELFEDLLSLPTESYLANFRKSSGTAATTESSLSLNLIGNRFNPLKYKFTKKVVDTWNKSIRDLCQKSQIRNAVQQMYEFDVTEASLKTFLYKLVSRITPERPTITEEIVLDIFSSYEEDDKVSLLCGLSVLELCLIIAMKHHSEIYDRDPFNFEIILARFTKFSKSSTSMQTVDRPIVLKAYEYLKNLELIVPVNNLAVKTKKEFQMHKMLLTYGQIRQAVSKYHALPTEVSQWAQSSLV